MMYDVVALGEMLIDFTHKGNTPFGYPMMDANPGGAVCNFLAALSSCGKKTAFIGKVGADTFGQLLKKTADEVGIDTGAMVLTHDAFTTLAFVTLDEHGGREFAFARKPGADTTLTKEELDSERLQNTRVFHFGTLSLTDEPAKSATREAVRIAQKAGALISLDPNYRAPLWNSEEEAKDQILWALGQADLVKISEEELQMLFETDIAEGASKLIHEFGVRLLFVTCGKKGNFFFTENISGFSPSFESLPTIDTTGAGDIFGGSAMARFLEMQKAPEELTYEDLSEICSFANAMAGISTTRTGGIPSVPKREEAQALLENS